MRLRRLRIYRRLGRILIPVALTAPLLACHFAPKQSIPPGGGGLFDAFVPPNGASTALAPLSWVGGISMLAGVVALFMSKGSRGWIPLAVGVGLVMLNFLILKFALLLFLPVVIVSGLGSAAYAFFHIRKLLRDKKNGGLTRKPKQDRVIA